MDEDELQKPLEEIPSINFSGELYYDYWTGKVTKIISCKIENRLDPLNPKVLSYTNPDSL